MSFLIWGGILCQNRWKAESLFNTDLGLIHLQHFPDRIWRETENEEIHPLVLAHLADLSKMFTIYIARKQKNVWVTFLSICNQHGNSFLFENRNPKYQISLKPIMRQTVSNSCRPVQFAWNFWLKANTYSKNNYLNHNIRQISIHRRNCHFYQLLISIYQQIHGLLLWGKEKFQRNISRLNKEK